MKNMKKDLSSDNERAYCELHDLCNFVEGKTAVSDLNETNYISTENMLQNKGGITKAAILPSVSKTQIYRSGDVLVSNIRPYFKKIWLASYDGGCSNDVLVMRPKNGVDNSFLYYLLADDRFFDYATSTSKGTKMPRGDRSAIMKYRCWAPEFSVQRVIGAFLKSLDDKITLNQKLNRNLAAQAQAILYQFMEELPYNLQPLSDIAEVIDCLHSKKPSVVPDSKYQLIQLDNIRDDGFLDMTACKYMISQVDYVNWTRKCEIVEGDCVITNVGRIGAVSQAPFGTKAAMGRNMTCIRLKRNKRLHAYFITVLLSRHMHAQIQSNTDEGTIMGALNVKNIPKLLFPIFDELTMNDLETLLYPIRKQIEYNNLQNQSLKALRDALLPKLMSGEIDVSKLNL